MAPRLSWHSFMFGCVFVSFGNWNTKETLKICKFWTENLRSMLQYLYIKRGLLVVVLRFFRVSWTLLWLVYGFLSFIVIKKSDCINFKSTLQIPESSQFQILLRGGHFRSGIIYGTILGSYPFLGLNAVRGSFAGRYITQCLVSQYNNHN